MIVLRFQDVKIERHEHDLFFGFFSFKFCELDALVIIQKMT
jgi:hypothetical protein